MSAARCVKLALLLSLIPLALRATTSLLLSGHGGVPAAAAAAASSRHSWATWHGQSSRATAAATVVSTEPVRGRRPCRRAGPRSAAALAASGGTRRLRQVAAGGDWFADDKRLAPTGSNPLHNLR